jgi:hypothetical protein
MSRGRALRRHTQDAPALKNSWRAGLSLSSTK